MLWETIHLSHNLPLVLTFLIIRTVELYSYDMLLELNLHFEMENGIFCWSIVLFLGMCIGGKQMIS